MVSAHPAEPERSKAKKRQTSLVQTLIALIGILLISGAVLFSVIPGPEVHQQVRKTSVTGNAAAAGETTVTTRDKEVPDGVIVAILGFGALFLLAATFYNRISRIDFPGSGGITLNPLTQAAL